MKNHLEKILKKLENLRGLNHNHDELIEWIKGYLEALIAESKD